MPIEFREIKGNLVKVRASGRLSDEDYDEFVPRMEQLIDRWGRVRMLFEMSECEGWDLQGAWDELKFEARHRKDVKRVAVVGDSKWEEWASRVSRILTGSNVRYFDQDESSAAHDWIEEGW